MSYLACDCRVVNITRKVNGVPIVEPDFMEMLTLNLNLPANHANVLWQLTQTILVRPVKCLEIRMNVQLVLQAMKVRLLN